MMAGVHEVKCQSCSRVAPCPPLGLPSGSLALEKVKANMGKQKVLVSLKTA